MKRNVVVFHDFYCIKCGNRSYTLPRQRSHLHEKFHRKVLYCPQCHMEINHVECFNEQDAYDFRTNFENGAYQQEVDV